MPSRPSRLPSVRPAPPVTPRASAADRGYGSAWQRARLAFLAAHPLCVACEAKGRTVEATVVDHKTPHKGDKGLFWDRDNWQALCGTCHGRKTTAHDGGFGRPVTGRV